MYLYGMKKENLSTKVKKFFEMVEDEMIFSIGRNCLLMNGKSISLDNIYEDMVSILEESTSTKKDCLENALKVAKDFDANDLMAIKNYFSESKNSFYKSYNSEKEYTDEEIFSFWKVIIRNDVYVQLVATKAANEETFSISLFDNELNFIEKFDTGIAHYEKLKSYVSKTYDMAKGIMMHIYSSDISSNTKCRKFNYVYVTDTTSRLIKNGETINKLDEMYVIMKHSCGDRYIVKPAINPKKHYMNSGNFVYTSHSVYEFSYPLPVFDQC